MRPVWDDVSVRARGLALHLLTRSHLEALARVSDLWELTSQMAAAGFDVEDTARSIREPGPLERSVRRTSQGHLTVLAHWSANRSRHLVFAFEDEDRRSLRALVRGAVAGVDSPSRLAGLVPTSSLPERALAELARLQTPAEISSMLRAMGNPYGPAIQAEAEGDLPDLFMLEVALDRTYAARAAQGTRGGGRRLKRFVAETIDLGNVHTALLLAAQGEDVDPAGCFVEHGRHLARETFLAAAAPGEATAAIEILTAAVGNTPLAEIVSTGLHPDRPVEHALLAARLRVQLNRARRASLSPDQLLAFLLRLRAQSVDLQSIIWGVALERPRPRLIEGLVSLP